MELAEPVLHNEFPGEKTGGEIESGPASPLAARDPLLVAGCRDSLPPQYRNIAPDVSLLRDMVRYDIRSQRTEAIRKLVWQQGTEYLEYLRSFEALWGNLHWGNLPLTAFSSRFTLLSSRLKTFPLLSS